MGHNSQNRLLEYEYYLNKTMRYAPKMPLRPCISRKIRSKRLNRNKIQAIRNIKSFTVGIYAQWPIYNWWNTARIVPQWFLPDFTRIVLQLISRIATRFNIKSDILKNLKHILNIKMERQGGVLRICHVFAS